MGFSAIERLIENLQDRSVFSCPNTRKKWGENNNIHNVVKQWMTEFGHGGCVLGSNALWVYMVDNASLRSYIIHQDQLRIFTPKSQGKKGEKITIFTT